MGEYEWADACRSIRLDLLELLGSEFVIEHVVAEYNKKVERRLYRCYTSDMLKAVVEGLGATVDSRFADLLENKPQDERTGDEIALDVIKRAGLKGKA